MELRRCQFLTIGHNRPVVLDRQARPVIDLELATGAGDGYRSCCNELKSSKGEDPQSRVMMPGRGYVTTNEKYLSALELHLRGAIHPKARIVDRDQPT